MMQKTKSALFTVAGVLALVYVVLNMIAGTFWLVQIKENPNSFWYVFLETIVPYFIDPVILGILLAIGLFSQKRSLIAGCFTAFAVWPLLDLLLAFIVSLFAKDVTFSMNRDMLIRTVLRYGYIMAWYAALALMVLPLFKRAQNALSPDATAEQTQSAKLFRFAALLMLVFTAFNVIYGVLLISNQDYNDSSALSDTRLFVRDIILLIVQPLAAGILVAIGLLLKKRTPVLIGLAVPAVASVLYIIQDCGALFRVIKYSLDKPFYDLAQIADDLAGTAWRLVPVFLVLGLFVMIRAKKRETSFVLAAGALTAEALAAEALAADVLTAEALPESEQPADPEDALSVPQDDAADDTDAGDTQDA